MSLLEKRFYGFQSSLNLRCIEISGPDSETFLQGQTSNCVKSLHENYAQYNTLLNRQGRVEFFFVITKLVSNHFLLWISASQLEGCLKRLESYLIADDVELKTHPAMDYHIVGGICLEPSQEERMIPFLFLGESVFLSKKLNAKFQQLPILTSEELNYLNLSRGFYSLDFQRITLPLLNETIAIEIAWNQQKGCFLGQEVVQKIYSRRGAALYPFMLKVKVPKDQMMNSTLCLGEKELNIVGVLEEKQEIHLFTFLPREYHLDGLKVELKIRELSFDAQVGKLQLDKIGVDEFYHKAIEYYSLESKHEEAITMLKHLILYGEKRAITKDNLAEWYETLGAIYGKIGMYQEAMEQMHKVADLLPDEVMPYTNLSLYAMKLGKIEEAEKYKEEATVKSFFKLGKEAKSLKQEVEKNLTREKMFKDVLEIDEFDPMAICGLAEIELSRKEPHTALMRIKKLHSVDDKYSQSYLLLGLAQESLGLVDEAKTTWQKGLSIALSKGELMPAQQFQSHLFRHSS